MNILNQSIPPTGQPLFPPKTSPSISQHLPLPQSFQRNSLTLSKGGEPILSDSICRISETAPKFIRIDEATEGDMGQYKAFSYPNITLSVSVSSAVKLDSKQIELIARKMRRLTGFRNLKMENIVDPSLIAGFVISYGDGEDHVIDLSVRSQLDSMSARVESPEKRVADNVKSWAI